MLTIQREREIRKIEEIRRKKEREEQLKKQHVYELKIKKQKKKEIKRKLEEEERIKKEKEKKLKEMKEKIEKANIQWNNTKEEIISNYLNSIDYLSNILYYIKNDISIEYDKYVNLCISFIRSTYFYKKNIKKIFNKYLKRINNENLQSEKQNYILIGKTGAGKSCLINYLLSLEGKNRAKEGETLDPETSSIQRYENKNKNFTLTDTIGIEATNEDRSLKNIEEMIRKYFDKSSKKIKDNIHGIIYCIKSDSTRVEQNERNLIKRLKEIYPKKGIKIIIALTYHINSSNKLIYNSLKKEFGDSIAIFEVNSKKAMIDLDDKEFIIKEKGKEKIIDFINSNSKEASYSAISNYKYKKIKDLYKSDYNNKKYNLINNIGDCSNKYYLKEIISELLSDETLLMNFLNLQYIKEIDELSIQIRDSFHDIFIDNLINELSDKLTEEKNKIVDCNIKENCSVIAEEKINNYFNDKGYDESNSIVYSIFHKKLIGCLFDIIANDLVNDKYK